jgi:hypothetical protein
LRRQVGIGAQQLLGWLGGGHPQGSAATRQRQRRLDILGW